jgi:acetolactate synthase-1/2/3 large subunit
MREFARLLAGAERPFAILGGGGWNEESVTALRGFLESAGLPTGCAFRRQDLLDNRSPVYAGDIGIGVNPKLAQRVKDADVLLVIGARLGETTTSGYTLLEVPVPRQKLIHVHAGAEELGRVYQATLPINSGTPQFVDALAGMQFDGSRWKEQLKAARADYEAWTVPKQLPGRLQYGEIIGWLREHLPEDAIVTGGAGNFASWLHRHFQYRCFRTQLGPTNGSMGYGVPAAIAAKLVEPLRTVVALTGDGDFLMNGQELATASQFGAGIVVLLINNGMYGTIRMHQEREYPERVFGTELANPDFTALARAYGGQGELVEETAQFAPAFQRALGFAGRERKPALIELRIDPDAIAPGTTLSAVRAAGLERNKQARG